MFSTVSTETPGTMECSKTELKLPTEAEFRNVEGIELGKGYWFQFLPRSGEESRGGRDGPAGW